MARSQSQGREETRRQYWKGRAIGDRLCDPPFVSVDTEHSYLQGFIIDGVGVDGIKDGDGG
jgi:hypothetical protein